jgi:flagellar basal-body rod modification protein FlgD
MNINQLSQAGNSGTNSSTTTALNNQLTSNDFITLLVTQLKQQDPTNPVDPTQFVTQLVQFNTLEQVMQINQILQNYATSAATNPPALTSAVKP